MKNSVQLDNILPKQRSSNAWQGIVKAKNIFAKGITIMVRNGRNTAFWLDIWVGNQPLYVFLTHEIPLIELYQTVFEY